MRSILITVVLCVFGASVFSQLSTKPKLVGTWCQSKTEQYWFVPANSSIEHDEMIPAEKVRVNRLLVGYYENPISQPAKSEFANKLEEFVAELKNNPAAEGFIIRNNGISNREVEAVLQRLRKAITE